MSTLAWLCVNFLVVKEYRQAEKPADRIANGLSLLFLQDDTGINNLHTFILAIDQHRVGI